MSYDVVCLRPEADFTRAGVTPPAELKIAYRAPDAADLPALMKDARALLIPAVGPKLPAALFENSTVKFVQITGAGVDRLDAAALKKLGVAVANVPGGSNAAVSEYAVTAAATLLRRLAWSDREIKAGNYTAFRARMVADNLAGLQGLLVGVVGAGVVGTAVAQAFHRAGAQLAFFDPAPRDPAALAALGAKSLALDELLRACDVVTLHVPLLPATQNLLDARRLALMKADAILVNASRGGVVDETALVAQLASGQTRRRRGRRVLDRTAGRRQSVADRAGCSPPGESAADAAYRRRHAPGFDLPVPGRLRQYQTRRHRWPAAA